MTARFKPLFISMAALLLSLLPLGGVYAQSVSTPGFAAAISPLPILLNVKPGGTASTDLRVNNPSTHDEKLKVVVKTFTQDGPNGTITLHDPTPADDFISWISFSKTEFDAPPGLWQTIKMTINVPKTASFGYYFAVEFTSANPPARGATNGTAIQGAVASFVLLNAEAPGEVRQMRVDKFTADHRFYEFLPVNFTIRLHNSGNVYAGASGNIFIMRGAKQIGVINVNENHGLVLPASNRLFNASWNSGFPIYKQLNGADNQTIEDKSGSPKQNLSWNFSQVSKLRFGHYTAKLALVYSDGQRDVPITGTLSFWVVPWRLIILVLLLIAGPAILVYVIMRRRFKKRLEKERANLRHENAK